MVIYIRLGKSFREKEKQKAKIEHKLRTDLDLSEEKRALLLLTSFARGNSTALLFLTCGSLLFMRRFCAM